MTRMPRPAMLQMSKSEDDDISSLCPANLRFLCSNTISLHRQDGGRFPTYPFDHQDPLAWISHISISFLRGVS